MNEQDQKSWNRRCFNYFRSVGLTPQEAHQTLKVVKNGGLLFKRGDEYILFNRQGERVVISVRFDLFQVAERRVKTNWDRFVQRLDEMFDEMKITAEQVDMKLQAYARAKRAKRKRGKARG